MFRVAARHHQLGTTSIPQCPRSWWLMHEGDPRSCTPTASRVPHKDPCTLPRRRMGRPRLCPIPREHQSFPLAPAFPPAVAGMRWPREQCRHLALVTSVTAREQLPGPAPLPRSRQEADGDDTGCHFLWQDVRLSPPRFPCWPSRALGTQGITAPGCRSPVPHTGTSTLLHPVPSPSWGGTCGTGTGLQCQHIRGAPRSSTRRNLRHGTFCHCPQHTPEVAGGEPSPQLPLE